MESFTIAPHDFVATPVTSTAWVEISTNLTAGAVKIDCSNSSGEKLYFGKSTDSSDPSVNLFTIFETGLEKLQNFEANDDIFLKAIGDTANSGELSCNFDKVPTHRR